MRVFITGVAGFIGSHLADKLLDEDCEVWGCDTFKQYHPAYPSELKRKNVEHNLENPNYNLIEGDFAGEEVAKVLLSTGFDYIIHLAAHAGVLPSLEDPEEYYQNNVVKSAKLLKLISKSPYQWQLKFIFASSSSVYGGIEKLPWKETMDTSKPLSPYAGTKKALEDLCYMYHKITTVPMVGLRFFTVYGPRQRPDMAIAKFTKAIDEGTPIQIYGEQGQTFRDYTYIDDIVNGILSCLPGVAPFDIYNIGNGDPVELHEMLAEIGMHMGKVPVAEIMTPQDGETKSTHASTDKLSEDYGYQPVVPYQEGIKRYVDWYNKSKN